MLSQSVKKALPTGTNEDLNGVFVLDSNFTVAVGDKGTIRFNNPATVRATFDSYRGDDRIIYWQELFN